MSRLPHGYQDLSVHSLGNSLRKNKPQEMDIQHALSHLNRERKKKILEMAISKHILSQEREKKIRYNIKWKLKSRWEEPQLFWKFFDNTYKCNPKGYNLAWFCFPHPDQNAICITSWLFSLLATVFPFN